MMVGKTILLCVAAALWASPGAAFERPRKEPDAKPQTCPEVGEGYVRLPGSDTCVRIGGPVRVEAATVRGGR